MKKLTGLAPHALILLLLLLLALWNMPPSAVGKALLENGAAGVMYKIGLDQNWGIFSPAIAVSNWRIKAEILYKNGETTVWDLPRANRYGLLGKAAAGRKIAWGYWTAYFVDSLPDAARYAARLHAKNPGNPPVRVVLVQEYAFIPAPTPGKTFYPIPKEHKPNSKNTLLTYEVLPEDLR